MLPPPSANSPSPALCCPFLVIQVLCASMGVLSMTRKGLLAAAILASLTERSWAFLTPAIWSRIQGHLRFYGQAPEASLSAVGNGVFSSAGRAAWASGSGASAFGRRLQRLDATASFSTGDFGDELNFAELRQQLAVLENQLASAMNLGTSGTCPRAVDWLLAGELCCCST